MLIFEMAIVSLDCTDREERVSKCKTIQMWALCVWNRKNINSKVTFLIFINFWSIYSLLFLYFIHISQKKHILSWICQSRIWGKMKKNGTILSGWNVNRSIMGRNGYDLSENGKALNDTERQGFPLIKIVRWFKPRATFFKSDPDSERIVSNTNITEILYQSNRLSTFHIKGFLNGRFQ